MNERSNLDLNFSIVFDSLRSKLWVLILAALVACGIVYGYITLLAEPLYSSTATLYIGKSTGELSNADVLMSESLAKDYEVIMKRSAVLKDVRDTLKLDMSVKDLEECISVQNVSGTRILDITALTPDPKLSKSIADSVCNVASEKFVELFQVDYVSIVDYGTLDSTPANINLPISLILAALIGVLFAALWITAVALMDDNLKNPDDVERHLGLSVLGSFPRVAEIDADGKAPAAVKKRHKK